MVEAYPALVARAVVANEPYKTSKREQEVRARVEVVRNAAATIARAMAMGAVVVESGGVLSPGLSPGTITVGGLTLMSGAALNFELGATRDPIVVIEEMTTVYDSLITPPPAGSGQRTFFKITANSAGANAQTEAVLETTYARPF